MFALCAPLPCTTLLIHNFSITISQNINHASISGFIYQEKEASVEKKLARWGLHYQFFSTREDISFTNKKEWAKLWIHLLVQEGSGSLGNTALSESVSLPRMIHLRYLLQLSIPHNTLVITKFVYMVFVWGRVNLHLQFGLRNVVTRFKCFQSGHSALKAAKPLIATITKSLITS